MVVNPDIIKAKWRTIAAWGLGLLAVIAAPTIYYYAIATVEMIWALAMAAGSILVISAIAPAFMDWVGDMRYKAAMAVAEANPIETMISIEQEKANELKAQEDNTATVDTQYRNVVQVVLKLQKTDPDDVAQFIEVRDKLKECYDEMALECDEAQKALEAYSKERAHAQRLWDAAVVVNKALDASSVARANVFRDIKQKIAFDAVNSKLNLAFSKLDTTVRRRQGMAASLTSPAPIVEGEVVAPKALTTGSAPVIASMSDLRQKAKG